MESDYLLLRYGEIFLKGKNRGIFERKLVENIKKITSRKPIMSRGRLLMDYFSDHELLKRVFGLVSYSPAIKVGNSLAEIEKAALNTLSGKKGTFRIQTKRSDKRFQYTSPELNQKVGMFIEKNTELSFSLKNSDHVLHIEINQEGVYLFIDVINCFGGLPTGVGGKVFLFLENESSLLAGLLMMKRGCDVVPIASSKRDISLLQKFSPIELKLRLITDINELFNEGKVVISGQNYEGYEKYETGLMIFRPLIAFSDEGIKKRLEMYDGA